METEYQGLIKVRRYLKQQGVEFNNLVLAKDKINFTIYDGIFEWSISLEIKELEKQINLGNANFQNYMLEETLNQIWKD